MSRSLLLISGSFRVGCMYADRTPHEERHLGPIFFGWRTGLLSYRLNCSGRFLSHRYRLPSGSTAAQLRCTQVDPLSDAEHVADHFGLLARRQGMQAQAALVITVLRHGAEGQPLLRPGPVLPGTARH